MAGLSLSWLVYHHSLWPLLLLLQVQNIMLNHGVWISQQLARKLPNCFALRETPYLNFRPRKEQLCEFPCCQA
jgi:hypothetical protein